MTYVCLHCGVDLTDNSPIKIDDLYVDVYGPVIYKGKVVLLSMYEKRILHFIAKAGGQYVSTEAIKNKLYGEDRAEMMDSNTVNVFMCRMRKRFREVDPSFDKIDTQKGRNHCFSGTRWVKNEYC
jgi:DNA-binding response OmpR family regulator